MTGKFLCTNVKKTFFQALLCGMVTVLALPPLSFLPAVIGGIGGFGLLLRRAQTASQAAFIGWSFFFGYHLLGLYWISFSLFTDIGRYWWLVPFSVTGLPAGLGIFGAVIGAATWRLGGARSWHMWLALGGCWTVIEYARTHILTGFPWNLIGMVWGDWLAVAQLSSLMGLHGLGLLTVLSAGLMLFWPNNSKKRRAMIGAAMISPWVIGAIWGMGRLETHLPDHDNIRLWLVQPNIDMAEKHDRTRQQRIMATLIRLSQPPIPPNQQTIIIWPETAIPYDPGRDPELRAFLQQSLPSGAWLITGAPRRVSLPDQQMRYYNSLYVQNPNGDIAGYFDKKHLVPFGEYMPLRTYLPLDAIAAGSVDLSPGDGPRLVQSFPLPPFAASICYEAIFPGAVTDPDQYPAWMLNLTNDGWFGHSAGPHQHLAMARMRAIEEGVPMVRVANTGISGVIDAFGRIRVASTLGTETAFAAPLPTALPMGTFYKRWRDGF